MEKKEKNCAKWYLCEQYKEWKKKHSFNKR